MPKSDLVFSVSIAEFNITIGNTLTKREPEFELPGFSHEDLANLCLPDGAHLFVEDMTYLVLPVPDDFEALSAKLVKHSGARGGVAEFVLGAKPRFLFGVAYYFNKRDVTVKRGAIQRSILVLMTEPMITLLEPILRDCMVRYMETPEQKLLSTFQAAANKAWRMSDELVLFGRKYPLSRPVLLGDEFQGASVLSVVEKFGEDTMLIWRALLLNLRVMIVGQPAQVVCRAAISVPLLVRPITGLMGSVSPYVALTDTTPLEETQFIAGATNLLFELKAMWYDQLCSWSTGRVTQSTELTELTLRLSSGDRKFIRSVMHGIGDKLGERWVREQFQTFTLRQLERLSSGNARAKEQRDFQRLKASPAYQSFLSGELTLQPDTESASTDQRTALGVAGELLEAVHTDPSSKHVPRLLHDLSKKLNGIEAIDEVIGSGVLTAFLQIMSHEGVKASAIKWCVTSLAQLAIALRGQLLILTTPLLGKVLELTTHEMTNVRDAALRCVVKLSSLQVGATTLASLRVPEQLFGMVCNVELNLALRTLAAQALAQLARVFSAPPTFDVSKLPHLITGTPDETLQTSLILLADKWQQKLPRIELSSGVNEAMEALHSKDLVRANQRIKVLQQHVRSTPRLCIELVQAGAIPLLISLAASDTTRTEGTITAFTVLQQLVNLHTGRVALGANPNGLLGLLCSWASRTSEPLSVVFLLLRILEAFAQHHSTATQLVSLGYIGLLVQTITRYIDDPLADTLALPAISCIRHIIRYAGDRAQVIEQCQPIAVLADHIVAVGMELTEGPASPDPVPVPTMLRSGSPRVWAQMQILAKIVRV